MDETQIELELYNLMGQLKQVSLAIENATKIQLEQVETLLRDIEIISEPYSKESVELQDKIKALTLQRGKSLKTGSGNITYRKGGIRRSWDLDGLDRYCEKFPDIKATIGHLKTEKEFEPQILIKVDTEGKSNATL
jgi:hypothetical protein